MDGKGPPSLLGYDKFLAKTSPALISLIESVIKQVSRLWGWGLHRIKSQPDSWVRWERAGGQRAHSRGCSFQIGGGGQCSAWDGRGSRASWVLQAEVGPGWLHRVMGGPRGSVPRLAPWEAGGGAAVERLPCLRMLSRTHCLEGGPGGAGLGSWAEAWLAAACRSGGLGLAARMTTALGGGQQEVRPRASPVETSGSSGACAPPVGVNRLQSPGRAVPEPCHHPQGGGMCGSEPAFQSQAAHQPPTFSLQVDSPNRSGQSIFDQVTEQGQRWEREV